MAKKVDYTYQREKENRKRQLNKNKLNKRPQGAAKQSRRKNWTDYNEEEDIETFERIMPLDESDRRRANEKKLKTVPASVEEGDEVPLPAGQQALVTEVSAGMCRVSLNGETWLCVLRGALESTGFTNVVTVGDGVIVNETAPGEGVVEYVLPRRNYIARPDPFYGHLQQLLVANIDQLLIVAAWRNPSIWTELIDRYLITAQRHDIEPVICVNKIDLAENPREVERVLAPYSDFTVICTSATRGDGLIDLREQVDGKISVLAGLSGVGKSSLLTAIHPDFVFKAGEVNEERGQGRHTTTQATMMPLGETGYVIDTPGIREFGLYGLSKDELIDYYPDLAEFAPDCRFTDCTHHQEPDCAVREAVESSEASQQRYENYHKIWETLAD